MLRRRRHPCADRRRSALFRANIPGDWRGQSRSGTGNHISARATISPTVAAADLLVHRLCAVRRHPDAASCHLGITDTRSGRGFRKEPCVCIIGRFLLDFCVALQQRSPDSVVTSAVYHTRGDRKRPQGESKSLNSQSRVIMEPNPGLIQDCPQDYPNSTPLVLFHDGGGTTISYYHIGPLNRTVYGIADPHFFTGRAWSGLPRMARIYANLIQSTVKSARVFLGGWSLGGFIALEVAQILQSKDLFHVVGVVMIDSPYPHGSVPDALAPVLAPPRPFFHSHCAPETRMLVSQSMKRARRLVDKWTVPDWSPSPDTPEARGPLPVVLLRCKEYVPHDRPQDGVTSLVSVDRWRHMRLLWEGSGGLVRTVLDIPGHHFNVMWEENVRFMSPIAYGPICLLDYLQQLEPLTTQLKFACKMLDFSMVK
ncbi:thioesterase domain-containing protein [Aspergillus affinis]|uniref:thioesterase domain-containing protein n=1 Tax=Aspergillus affinis TaxID=1070780 RepID=UPI0022FEF973|nr:alpha/beta-hydrolase [Aspergillus affinis]KAI9044183.1 alpha/beta-hydrolase [Aspergillus affinis]